MNSGGWYLFGLIVVLVLAGEGALLATHPDVWFVAPIFILAAAGIAFNVGIGMGRDIESWRQRR